jgi:xanthine dehydrogenase accessory factor
VNRETLDALLEARVAKRPVALLTRLVDGGQRLVEPASLPADLDTALAEAVTRALRSDRCVTLEAPGGEVFVQVFNPALRLLVVGAVHIAQALAPLAARLGYEVTVVDPRRSFATAERFPGVRLETDWPDEALEAFAPDSRTAVVTLTHAPKLGDPALAAALRSPAFYIGCLGSTRTHARRLERLREAGFGEAALERLHGPLGLAIGARSPAEIALSTLAQITGVLRGGRVQ